jgi:peptide subunit release factor 1 (eRF1)
MFTKQELKELATFHSKAPPVLSVYLNTDVTQLTAEQSRLALKGLLKSVAGKAAAEDLETVEQYVDLEYDWQGKGLAIFSAGDFWRVQPLVFPVSDAVYAGTQPFIKPLADYFEAYDRYGVVLVDREGARLFLFNQGTLQDATGLLGEEIKERDHGAAGRGGRSGRGSGQGRAAPIDSHIEQVAARNLRDVVDLTQRFYQAGQCERIILGGTEENRARFLSMLPKTLQGKVIGDVSIDMYASPAEVLNRTSDLIQRSVAERKDALVKGLITAAHKDMGSLGLADTLLAVQEQRVQTLVIAEGLSAPGSLCTHCGYLSLDPGPDCTVCEGTTRQVQDVVDHLVRRAVEMDVEVVFVHDEALGEDRSVGAIWRF